MDLKTDMNRATICHVLNSREFVYRTLDLSPDSSVYQRRGWLGQVPPVQWGFSV